ncbi:MAG: carboxypeptidase-like regulatory domain-containing protein [Butyricimonas faecihominis]
MKKKPIYYTFRECIFGNNRFLKRFLSLLSLFVIGNIGVVMAQEVPKFTVDFKDASLTEVFDYFGKNSDYKFTYNSENVKNETKKITESFKNVTLEQILTKCLDGTRFSFEIVDKNVVITLRKQPDVKLIEISGRVVDENGNPIPGATVLIQGTSQGVATNMDGRYTINVRPTDALRVSFIGYKTAIVELKGKTKVNVRLNPEEQNLDEVQVVAFGTQKKESVVSAITTIRPMDLKSSSSDLTSSFAGKIAGIIGWQTGGAPGALTEEEMNNSPEGWFEWGIRTLGAD